MLFWKNIVFHYWLLLFIIALYDLREQRIPNILLATIIMIRILELGLHLDVDLFLLSLKCASILFGLGLLLYFMKAMSPGDVKLLFVIGFISGTSHLVMLIYWILMASGIVAGFCYFHRKANSPLPQATSNVGLLQKTGGDVKIQSKPIQNARYGNKLVMPFAPSILIGMAMFSYFN